MLDAFMPLYTPGVRRLYSFEAHGDQHLLAAEIRRTLEQLAATVAARVDKGTLTIDEAKRETATWLVIAEDLEEQDRWQREGAIGSGWSLADRLKELRATNGVAWTDKVAALRREIEARRYSYPGQIDKGLLTRDAAKAQLECLEAVHDLYWRHGYAFDGTAGELRELSTVVLDSNLHETKVLPIA